MATFITIQPIALSFPETTEAPHFDKTAFKVKKKIFATYTAKKNQLSLKLSEIDQDVFAAMGGNAIYPVPNKWGKQGWTILEIEQLPKELLIDALTAAYCEVAQKKLADQVKSTKNL